MPKLTETIREVFTILHIDLPDLLIIELNLLANTHKKVAIISQFSEAAEAAGFYRVTFEFTIF